MALGDLTERGAVLRAIAEFDRLGPDEFLTHYGFGPARRYFVVWEGRRYDSKAIAGVAHNFQHPDREPLTAATFSGGEATVAAKLRELGFVVDSSGAQRNPAWAWDELILAMDLYVEVGGADDRHPKVIALSELLNRLPIHSVRPDLEKFRNPNGVALKLANFAALDPEYPGVGMSRGGRLDLEVWDRYTGARDELHALARRIADGVDEFPTAPEEGEEDIQEGRLVYRQHRTRERNAGIVKRKKDAMRGRGEPLRCEVCGFDFEASYGDRGRDFIECHHVVPLSKSGTTTTRLQDLALVCSNCHRMIHRWEPWTTIAELRDSVTRRT